MRPPESFIGQPIRSLQTMLRVIAEDDGNLPSVIPDGIYSQQTISAVSEFQRRFGLPVTGVTDQGTWDAIVAVYEPALVRAAPAQPLEIILDPGEIIRKGQRHPNLYLVQGMLIVFAESYHSFPKPEATGVLDIPTSEAIAMFQELNGLPMTGELDKNTWKHMVLHYPSAAAALTEEQQR